MVCRAFAETLISKRGRLPYPLSVCGLVRPLETGRGLLECLWKEYVGERVASSFSDGTVDSPDGMEWREWMGG